MRRLALAALVALVATTGCGSAARESAFEDRTAVVNIDQRIVTFTVDACGLDGQTFRMAGRAESGEVLQAVIDLEADDTTGIPAATGMTVFDWEGTDVSAFGEEAWARRDMTGAPPGEIGASRIQGARIQIAGEVAVVDQDEVPIGGELEMFTLDARCDEKDG